MNVARTMTVGELVARYNAGERDFSGVVIANSDFGGMDLRGAILKNANLSYSNFRDVKLNGADLSGANIEWSDFTRADLRDANLEGVRAVWNRFNDAHFGNTNMQRANLSNSIFFRADLMGGATLTNANMTGVRTRPEELTQQDIAQFRAQLGSLESVVDFNTLYYLQQLAAAAAEKVTAHVEEVKIGAYGTSGGGGVAMIGYKMVGGQSAVVSYTTNNGDAKFGVYGM